MNWGMGDTIWSIIIIIYFFFEEEKHESLFCISNSHGVLVDHDLC